MSVHGLTGDKMIFEYSVTDVAGVFKALVVTGASSPSHLTNFGQKVYHLSVFLSQR